MATLDELTVRITADTAQLKQKMREAGFEVQSATGKMQSALGGLQGQFASLVPAASIGALVAFGRTALSEADHINDLAQRIGFAGSTLSALNIPLRQAGSNLDEFAAAVNLMNNSIGEAAKGNEEAVKAFDAIGLSVAALKRLSPEQQFYAVAGALGQLKNQYQQTEAGRNIFGRGFAALIPVINQANGNLQGFVDTAKQAGNALTDDQLKRIDDFGDKWTETVEKLKLAMVNAMPVLQLYLDGLDAIINLPEHASRAGKELALVMQGLPANGRASFQRPKTPSDEELAASVRKQLAGGARGGNAGLLKPAADPVADYLRNLQQQRDLLTLAQPDREAQKAVYELQNTAQKANIKLTQAQIDKARELAKANYEAQNPDPVMEYVRSLQDENTVLNTAKEKREGVKAVLELENQLRKDGIALSDSEKTQIEALANANIRLKEQMEEAERFAKELHDSLSEGLADAILDFDSATDAANKFARAIANTVLQKSVTGPLANGILGALGMSGSSVSSSFVGPMPQSGGFLSSIGSFFGFASGGRPPVGVPSMVGEKGPELFVPDTAGTIVPNHKLGGGGVTVVNHWSISPGLQGTVEAEVRRMAPIIEARAQAGVFKAIERGGPEARLVGKRS